MSDQNQEIKQPDVQGICANCENCLATQGAENNQFTVEFDGVPGAKPMFKIIGSKCKLSDAWMNSVAKCSEFKEKGNV